MPTAGDEGMLERLERIEAKIDKLEGRLSTELGALESRLTTKIEDLDSRLTTKIEDGDSRLAERIDAQGRKFDVQFEQLRGDLKTFTENLGGRLDVVVLELQESRRDFNAKFLDQSLVLQNHGRRITALESHRSE